MNTATTINRYPPNDENFQANGGLIAVETAVLEGKARCALATVATVPPLGIFQGADNEDKGIASILINGWTQIKAGATFTPGTNSYVMTNGSGQGIPATAGNHYVGRAYPEKVIGVGEPMWMFVSPGVLPA